ncbi:MAG: endonuclease/exonuclease/phosphatase family protein [Planctomycetota bacterium]
MQTADFIKFAGLEEELREAGARIKASASAPFDFEPEYVAFAPDGATAYVTLQENNAVAVIDVATATVTDIIGLGTRDFATPGNGLDPLDDGNANIRTFDSDILVGWRMPDALEVFEVDGETFFVTANEGDSRDFDEERVEDLVDDGLLDEALEQRLRDQGLIDDDGDNDVGLERLEVSSVDGDTDGDGDIDVIHAFSTRGITIFDDDGAVVFDSGDLAEAFLAANFPDRFNDDDGDDGEDRSDAKGPEFEGVGVGEVDGELLLFALAERDSGVFVFNVNDPANPTFVNYIDGFSGSDQSPEVVEFISAADSTSGFAQIAVAYEVSGTVSLFDILPGGATIGSIQGAGATSAFEGQVVTAAGIVTAVDSDGFYLQDPVGDGDDATSDAIFVETGSAPTVAVGDEVEVTGTVEEDTPGGTSTRNLSTTQIADVTDVTVLSSGNALPEAIIIGTGGRIPPSESQPDAIAFFEAMESMRVTAQDVLATSPTNRFGEIFGVVDQGANATGVSSRNTLNIEPDDFNPEKVQIDEDSGIFNFDFPDVDAGALLGDVTGVLGYGFGNFEILVTEDFTGGITPSALAPETTSLTPADEDLTIATYNVLNLDPNETDGDTDVADGRFDAIAEQIVGALDAPDIIALQEIQDNSGETDDGTTAGDITLQTLVDSITAAGGPTYGFIDNTFITNNASGGAPGSNIRTAFLYDPTRVSVVEGSVQPVGDQEAGSPFDGARLPLSASFMFGEEEVTVVNNHFSSKSGSAAIMGTEQPFSDRQEEPDINGSLNERREQAQAVNDFVDGILAEDADAQVVVLGDLNEFEFVSPLDILKGEATSADDGFTLGAGDGTILENLIDELDPLEAYTFNFQGNSQVLDHVLVTSNLAAGAEIDILNVNTEFAETDMRASDHDPVLASLDFTPSVILSGDSGANTLVGGQDDDVLNGRGGADVLRGLAGDDRLIGGAGNDRMNGGADDDLLIGEGGNDRIVTGDGEDVIRIRNRDSGRDTITDFDVALDTIDLDGFGSLRLRDIDLGGRDGRVRLEVNDELVAILTGVDIDDLTRGNFDFG